MVRTSGQAQSVWSVSIIYLNQTNQIDQMDQMNKTGWRTFSAAY